MKRAGAAALAAAVASLGGCAWLWVAAPSAAPDAAQPAATLAAGAAPASAVLPAPPTVAVDPGVPAATALPASLQDTEADGGWRADAGGRLVVERAVRRRFDYWLSAVGEAPPEALGAQVMAAARRELPATAAADVELLWGRYLALQRHPWQRAVAPADPGSWRSALEERQSVRRQHLGRDWAEAFYADEEQALWRELLAWESGRVTRRSDEVTPPPEHPQAAQRVAEVEARWADWERRLAQARAEQARLAGAQELSELQRQQALEVWLAQRFSASEQLRVRALLGLPVAAGA